MKPLPPSAKNATEPDVSEAAALAHELRQPLFAIKALHQLALHRGEPLGPTEQRLVVEHVRQIEELLERVSSTAVTGAGSAGGAVDLQQPLAQAITVLRYLIASRGVTLNLHLPEGPVWVQGRSEALRQVATNLLHNALDAVREVVGPAIDVGVVLEPSTVVVWVQDNGVGIEPASREAVFQPHVTTKGASGGSGLGLYIARQLAEGMGGQLELGSAGQGARLELRMPRIPAPKGS